MLIYGCGYAACTQEEFDEWHIREDMFRKGGIMKYSNLSRFVVVFTVLMLAACGSQPPYYPQAEQYPPAEEAVLFMEYAECAEYTEYAASPDDPLLNYYWLWDSSGGQLELYETLAQLRRSGYTLSVNTSNQTVIAKMSHGQNESMQLTLRYADNDFVVFSEHQHTIFRNFITGETRFSHYFGTADTEEADFYDFIITQKINDAYLPFSFHFFAEKIERVVCYSPLVGMPLFDIRITDFDGNFIQQIDGVAIGRPFGRFRIYFYDFNFDGYYDMIIHQSQGGNRWFGLFRFWQWDNEKNQFVVNDVLNEHNGELWNNIQVDFEQQRILSWSSSAAGRHITYLEIIDGVLTPISTFEWIHFDALAWRYPDFIPPEGYILKLIRRDLIAGEEEIWFENWE